MSREKCKEYHLQSRRRGPSFGGSRGGISRPMISLFGGGETSLFTGGGVGFFLGTRINCALTMFPSIWPCTSIMSHLVDWMIGKLAPLTFHSITSQEFQKYQSFYINSYELVPTVMGHSTVSVESDISDSGQDQIESNTTSSSAFSKAREHKPRPCASTPSRHQLLIWTQHNRTLWADSPVHHIISMIDVLLAWNKKGPFNQRHSQIAGRVKAIKISSKLLMSRNIKTIPQTSESSPMRTSRNHHYTMERGKIGYSKDVLFYGWPIKTDMTERRA